MTHEKLQQLVKNQANSSQNQSPPRQPYKTPTLDHQGDYHNLTLAISTPIDLGFDASDIFDKA